MKNTKIAAAAITVAVLAAPVLAGNPEPVMDPIVIAADTAASSSSGTAIVAMMALLLLAGIVAN